MKKHCVYYKAEVSEPLVDMGLYDGICLKKKKGFLVQESMCLKGGGCKKWAEAIPPPAPKKRRLR